MKQIVQLNESQLYQLIKEALDDRPLFYDYLEDYGIYYILYEAYNGPNGSLDWKPLINPSMYQRALSEFQRFGKLDKFPSKYIYQWIGIIMKNTALIQACTELAGHSQYNPIDDIAERFGVDDSDVDYNNDTITVEENGKLVQKEYQDVMEEKGVYNYMVLPDGSDAWSDYGLSPLFEILNQYHEGLSPEETLVLINKALDVTHSRGDLSSAFIEGGKSSLNKISNRLYTEGKKRRKSIRLTEAKLSRMINEAVRDALYGPVIAEFLVDNKTTIDELKKVVLDDFANKVLTLFKENHHTMHNYTPSCRIYGAMENRWGFEASDFDYKETAKIFNTEVNCVKHIADYIKDYMKHNYIGKDVKKPPTEQDVEDWCGGGEFPFIYIYTATVRDTAKTAVCYRIVR